MISLSGLVPAQGSKNISRDTNIEFAILNNGHTMFLSTLNVKINGVTALSGGLFSNNFNGPDSLIDNLPDGLYITIDPENDFSLGSVILVEVYINTDDGAFKSSYAFKIVQDKPFLIETSPRNNQSITQRQMIMLSFSDLVSGLDPSTLTVSINNLEYVSNGVFAADYNGPGSIVTMDGPELTARIDMSTQTRDMQYEVKYRIENLSGVPLNGKFVFLANILEDSMPPRIKNVEFQGYYQGIDRVNSYGDGTSVYITWHKPLVRDYTFEPFLLIFDSLERLEIFDDGPSFIAKPTVSGGRLYDYTTGETYSFAVRAHEAIKGVFDFAGMDEVSQDIFRLPGNASVVGTIGQTSLRIDVDSVVGFPAAGLIKINNEVIQYTGLDTNSPAFLIPSGGRGLINTIPSIYIDGDQVSLFLNCQDENTAIVASTVEYSDGVNDDGYQTGREIDSVGILYPDFSSNDAKVFEGYDFCGYHKAMPQNTLQGIDDCGSYLGGEFNGMRGFNLYDRMLSQEEILLDQTGEPMILLSKIISGEKCFICADTRRDHPKYKSCKICYGTMYVGGYHQYCNLRREDRRLMVSVSESPDDLMHGAYQHLQQDFKPSAWTLPMPAIKDRDMLIRFDRNGNIEYIYEVLKVSREKILYQNFGRQKLELERKDKTDIIYTIVSDALLNNEFCDYTD